jgi:F0F1-type ATP synthase assembly protein I
MLEAVAIIVTGGLAGWIAARLVSGAGYGLMVNVIVGIIGGKLFAVLQIPVGSCHSARSRNRLTRPSNRIAPSTAMPSSTNHVALWRAARTIR